MLLIGQQELGHFLCIDPCFPLARGMCKFYANAGGKRPIQRQPLLVHYKHQANLLLLMLNYILLVICRNDKNKQLTFLSQCKLAFTGKKYVSSSVNSEGHLNKLNTRRDTSSGTYLSNICHQKPNTARETIPLVCIS